MSEDREYKLQFMANDYCLQAAYDIISSKLALLGKLLKNNQKDWDRSITHPKEKDDLLAEIELRRLVGIQILKEIAALDSLIDPLKKKLNCIHRKMQELETRIGELNELKQPGEDLEVCKQELEGLSAIVASDTMGLTRHIRQCED